MDTKVLFDELERRRIFPLHTLQSMANRWGVDKQDVQNWKKRDKEFPWPMVGIVAETKRTSALYPLFAVEKYEQLRDLVKDRG
jgi:hypothetical protein